MSAKKMKSSSHAKSTDNYWQQRFSSKDFHTQLQNLITSQLKLLAKMSVGDLIEEDLIYKLISEFDLSLIELEALADLIKHNIATLETHLRRKNPSVNKLIDKKLRKSIDDILDVEIELSEHAKDFVGKVMEAEFISSLFTDVIHVSIISFYKKINPVFGGLATTMLEKQIKSFIQMFIKIVLDRATQFIVSPQNIALSTSFAREVIKLILNEPVVHLLDEVSPKHREKIESALKEAAQNQSLDELIRELLTKVVAEIYPKIKNQKIGKYVALDKQADWLAKQMTELSLPFLQLEGVIEFITGEMRLAEKKDE